LSPPKDGLKLLIQATNLPNTAKNVIKLTLALGPPGGALGVLGGALTNFPCEIRLKCFLRPGGAGAPPGYAYAGE